MAAGDLMLLGGAQPTESNPALPNYLLGNSGNTPRSMKEIWTFDQTTIQYLAFYGISHNYAGGGFTLTFDSSRPGGASSAKIGWEAAMRRYQRDTTAFDASHTYTWASISGGLSVASAVDESVEASISISHSNAGSLAAGEPFELVIRRNTASPDDLAALAHLWEETIRLVEA